MSIEKLKLKVDWRMMTNEQLRRRCLKNKMDKNDDHACTNLQFQFEKSTLAESEFKIRTVQNESTTTNNDQDDLHNALQMIK